jgi:hypothetical protein
VLKDTSVLTAWRLPSELNPGSSAIRKLGFHAVSAAATFRIARHPDTGDIEGQ